FKQELDAREHAMSAGTQRQTELLDSLTKIEERITELSERSEAMLSGATVAGLAGSFGSLRDALSGELASARGAFYIGILVLVCSALPLVLYVVPGLAGIVGFEPSNLSSSHDPLDAFLN